MRPHIPTAQQPAPASAAGSVWTLEELQLPTFWCIQCHDGDKSFTKLLEAIHFLTFVIGALKTCCVG